MKMQKVTAFNCAELCSNCNLQCTVYTSTKKIVANCSPIVVDLFSLFGEWLVGVGHYLKSVLCLLPQGVCLSQINTEKKHSAFSEILIGVVGQKRVF